MGVLWHLLFGLLLGVIQVVLMYHQTDYGVKLERMGVVSYSHKYLRNFQLGLAWYNRTQRVLNGSTYYVQDFTEDIKIDVQVYKFLSNEYRFFPITMTLHVCDVLNKNLFGIWDMAIKYSNARDCPGKAGFYYLRNAALDFSAFPPYIPGGQYKMTMNFLYKSDLAIELEFYATVTTFITKWET